MVSDDCQSWTLIVQPIAVHYQSSRSWAVRIRPLPAIILKFLLVSTLTKIHSSEYQSAWRPGRPTLPSACSFSVQYR